MTKKVYFIIKILILIALIEFLFVIFYSVPKIMPQAKFVNGNLQFIETNQTYSVYGINLDETSIWPSLNRYNSFWLNIDKNGFRIPKSDSPYTKNKDAKKILSLGDSVAMGFMLDYEKSYAGLLNLEQNYNINNFSMFYGWGNTPTMHRYLKNNITQLKPDYVLLQIIGGFIKSDESGPDIIEVNAFQILNKPYTTEINEFGVPVINPVSRKNLNVAGELKRINLIYFFERNFNLVRLGIHLISPYIYKSGRQRYHNLMNIKIENYSSTLTYLKEINLLVQKNKAKFIFLFTPNRADCRWAELKATLPNLMQDLKNSEVLSFSFYENFCNSEILQEKPEFFIPFDIHPNEHAHRKIYETLMPVLNNLPELI